MTSETYFDKLKQIDFYSKEIHPELIPFVGTDYSKYRILQIGESHFISNYPEGSHGMAPHMGCDMLVNLFYKHGSSWRLAAFD